MLRKNEIFTATVEDMNFLGFGVAKINGFAVFISGAACGDTAKIKIIKVAKTYAVARVEEIISPSAHRIAENCPVSAACGVCAFRSVTYDFEKSLKENSVKMSFVKQGMRDVCVMPLTHAKLSHYRNKGQYPVRKDASGKTVIGFYAERGLLKPVECAAEVDVTLQAILRSLGV